MPRPDRPEPAAAGPQRPASPPSLDVLGLGNAIVDVLAAADDALVAALGLVKGSMTLVDAEQMARLYGRMGPGREVSGGSCANTMAAVAALGGRAGFVGKVRADQLGEVFGHDIRAAGVAFATPPSPDGPPTARCLIFVTPDGQRTMATYLGACVELGPDDVDEATVAGAAITYLEGYLWDRPAAKAACLRAAGIARRHGRRVALCLSDSFCVDRWRDEFLDLIDGHVDVLIANEAEITSLHRVGDFEAAVERTRDLCPLAALTRGPRGSVIVARGGDTHPIPAAAVPRVVDTTGAGDLYAAGFLFGLTAGMDLPACGRLGSLAAGRIVTHYGARPEAPLAPLVAEAAA